MEPRNLAHPLVRHWTGETILLVYLFLSKTVTLNAYTLDYVRCVW